jgi:hypothetical protein
MLDLHPLLLASSHRRPSSGAQARETVHPAVAFIGVVFRKERKTMEEGGVVFSHLSSCLLSCSMPSCPLPAASEVASPIVQQQRKLKATGKWPEAEARARGQRSGCELELLQEHISCAFVSDAIPSYRESPDIKCLDNVYGVS